MTVSFAQPGASVPDATRQMQAPPPDPPPEACPLCGAPLAPDQEWCLRCGAAARTRLAATPNWKGPVATIAVVAALALGVLAAALVKLAGDSGPAPAPTTTTVTTPVAGAAPTATLPGAATATQPTTPVPGTTPTTVVKVPTIPTTVTTRKTPTSPGGVSTNQAGGTPAP